MSKRKMLAVRIPEDKHKYVQFKALHSGKQIQELVTEMIDAYQLNDAEYMAKFGELISPTSEEEESNHVT